MTLPTDAKQAWLDGYIAASACTVTWAQNSGISDRSIVNLMSMLEIFDIMNKERDIRLIAEHIDMVYSSKKYYGVGLPMALQIAKNRVTRSDNYWQIQREFYALPIEVQDEFLRKYYGGFPNWTNADEFRKKFDEFMRNRKHQQK